MTALLTKTSHESPGNGTTFNVHVSKVNYQGCQYQVSKHQFSFVSTNSMPRGKVRYCKICRVQRLANQPYRVQSVSTYSTENGKVLGIKLSLKLLSTGQPSCQSAVHMGQFCSSSKFVPDTCMEVDTSLVRGINGRNVLSEVMSSDFSNTEFVHGSYSDHLIAIMRALISSHREVTGFLSLDTTNYKELSLVLIGSRGLDSCLGQLSRCLNASSFDAALEVAIPFQEQNIGVRSLPGWIFAVAQLLPASDYPRIIQRLNTEAPTNEHYVLHRLFRGIAYYKIGEFQQAMIDLTDSEKYAQETNQRKNVSLCNIYLGDLYYSLGSYSEAVKCYHKAAECYDHANNIKIRKLFRLSPPTLSAIHLKCGHCLRACSRLVEAVQEYKKSLKSAIGQQDRIAAHKSLGSLYQSWGRNSEALKEYEQALELARRCQDYILSAQTHGNIGNAYLGLGEKEKAFVHLQKALELTIKYVSTPAAIGQAYNNVGVAYQSMGDLDNAEQQYNLALRQAISSNDPSGINRVHGNIGNLLTAKKMFEKAISYYTKVIDLSTDETTVTAALNNRGCAYYEWAESKMSTLEKFTSNENLPAQHIVFRIHGSKTVSHEHSPRIVIDSIYKLYKQGKEDLEKVLASHERKLDLIKGSAQGLSLTISLFESNSRAVHRLQDCMVNLGNWREALLVAEQSRARLLGEMMYVKMRSQLDKPLTSPLNLKQVYAIVGSQSYPVLYLSYTGSSILAWVLVPTEDSSNILMEMFEVPLSDDQFNGESFEHYIGRKLTEIIVERSYDMYGSVEYSESYYDTVINLYELICTPLQAILGKLMKVSRLQKIVLITDMYTTMLPFACLYDPKNKTFFGEHFYLERAFSLLTMGIRNQLPEPIVELPADPKNFCIVGNPTVPIFYHNGEAFKLGKLSNAKSEAQWVGHILGTPPILDEQATRTTVVRRLLTAEVIHIATHGSSDPPFLAFSAPSSTQQEVIDSSSVLLLPEEVEHLSISPALVVLSSCDSARGTVKGDSIQGMARAFILAGNLVTIDGQVLFCKGDYR